jgi:WD40 repeat protein
MAKNPANRIQTAAEVAAFLEGYLAHLRQPATVSAPQLPPSPVSGCLGLAGPWRTGIVKWLPQSAWLPALLLLGAVGLGISLWFAVAIPGADKGPPGPKEKFQEYYHSFKGDEEIGSGYRYDGLEPESCVQFEPAGLRITLPEGVEKKRIGTGLATTFPIKGDFEITMAYEVLQEPEPADAGRGTGLYLWVDLTTPALQRAMLIRMASPGKQFTTWLDLYPEDVGKPPAQELRSFPATAMTGRLRLVRAGGTLFFYVAEGSADKFILIHQHGFSPDDIKEVRIGGQTGGPKAALDFRVTDLRIRAESMPNMPPETPKASGKKVTLVIGLASFLVITLSLAIWFLLRRRRRTGKIPPNEAANSNQAKPETAAPYVSFPCSDCGKSLKAKAGLAGKKLKCPQCGTAVRVPATKRKAPLLALASFSILKKWWVVGILAITPMIGLSAWSFWPVPSRDPASFIAVTLGSEAHPDIEETGFSYQEYDTNNQPFRWTDGHGQLVIPIDKEQPPQALAMELHIFRPAQVKTAWLQIKVNQRELFNEHIPLWKWEKTLDLSGLDLGEELVLDIYSDTFNPRGIMDGGTNDDTRTLGVQVWCVMLLPSLPKVEAAGRDINTPLHVWEGHPEGVRRGVLTTDGRILVSGAWDGTIKIWDVPTGKEQKTFPVLAPGLQALAVSPRGENFATAANDRVVRIWDTKTGKPKAAWPGHIGQITALAFAPDGATLASAGGDRFSPGALKLWNVATGKERFPIAPFKLRLWGLAYAPSGNSVAVAGGDSTVQIVDTNTGKVFSSLPLPAYGRSVAFSPDGKLLAVNYGDKGEVRIVGVDDGRERSHLRVPEGGHEFALSFAPDNRRLLTPCGDGTSIIWDVSQEPAKVLATLRRHEGKVCFGIIFPDGRTVVTGGDDGTIRLWNVGRPE